MSDLSEKKEFPVQQEGALDIGMEILQLQVPEDIYRAYRRCSWIVVHETGRSQLDIMEEMVRDFLVKHGC